MLDSKTFLPRVPQPVPKMQPVMAPLLSGVNLEVNSKAEEVNKRETLFSWLGESIKAGIKALPKTWLMLAIQLGVVLVVNFVFWQIKIWTLPRGIASLVSAIIFLTATYNNIIPKTIYWVIIFTFGKRLLFKMKKDGFSQAISPMKEILPEFKNAHKVVQNATWSLLLMGGGFGLVIANNFASYSRFSGARNKLDKYFIAIVISFAVSYILGESKKKGIFKFLKLMCQDAANLLKKQVNDTDSYTFLVLTGFLLGLLLDAPMILMKLKYGGYILGVLCLAGGIVWQVLQKAKVKK
ncbi:MAG: hypothetical protein ACYDEX_10150 [Mobilitalea sp.]